MMSGKRSPSFWPTMSTKYGASESSARGTMVSGSREAACAASAEMNLACAISCSTTLRRSRARAGEVNGERSCGEWMTPAIVAASARLTLLTSLPKNSRAASATPWMANDPRWPRYTSFR